MKLVSAAGLATLGIALGALGVTVVRLRRDVTSLERRVADLSTELHAAETSLPLASASLEAAPARRPMIPLPVIPAPSPPSPAAGVPAALAAPEARDEIRQIVAAEMNVVRARERGEWLSRREEGEGRFRERVVTELGLSEGEARRLGEILGEMQSGRRTLFEAVRNGEKTEVEVGPQLGALRQKTEQALGEMLGEERMKKFQEIQRQERRERGSGSGSRAGG